jgi:nicotinic acid mononucleotide adenylyltransferase
MAFAVTEIWFRLKNSRGSSLLFNRGNKVGEKTGRIPDSRKAELYDFHAINGNDDKIRVYSWDEVDSLVGQGQILVIGNGRYIYDASKWVSSHPGGKMILKTVAGILRVPSNIITRH